MNTLLALLDREHLDQSFFLKSLARELAEAQRAGLRVVLLHGDSPYTDRIMQGGVMREEASSRAARDLNHRLIALLADAGVSAIGLLGRQKNLVTTEGTGSGEAGAERPGAQGPTFRLDRQVWDALPPVPVVVLCGLLEEGLADLGALSDSLAGQIPASERIVFSRVDALQWPRVPIDEQLGGIAKRGDWEPFEQMHVPVDLHGLRGYRLVVPGVPGAAALVGGDLRVG